jgi:CDP-6-deoxy-D-xylo-4-hexulose-3-dehydrase
MQRLGVVSRHVAPAAGDRRREAAASEEQLVKVEPCAAKPPKKVWYAPNKFEAYGEEEIQAVTDCLRDGWLAPGPRTEEFEEKVSAIFGKKHGVMVNSGSSGNIIGLAVLGLKPGDEVVTPACTFSTAVAPILQLGLTPVFCDIVPDCYVPTVEQVLAKITPKTKCLLLPNLAGSKPDWKELRARVPKGIWLFEDSCDSITYTAESDISVISFYASHIITAGGMGGVVMFNDPKLKERALQFRDWGRIGNNTEDMSERFGHQVDGIEYDFKFLYGCLGYNMKSCEMCAAFGLAQLKKLDKFRAIRARNINRYVENLRKANTRYVVPQRHEEFDWLAFPLLYHDRKGVLRYLESNDVQIRVFFAGNITRHPAYRQYLGSFPGSDTVMRDGFLLGAHHGLELEDIDRVCDLLIEYDRKNGAVTAGSAAAPAKERDSVSLDL